MIINSQLINETVAGLNFLSNKNTKLCFTIYPNAYRLIIQIIIFVLCVVKIYSVSLYFF